MNESLSVECDVRACEQCTTRGVGCSCDCHEDEPGTVTRAQLDGMRACFAAAGLDGGMASEQSAFIRSVIGGDWDWMSQLSSLSRAQAGDVLFELGKRLRPSRQPGRHTS